MVEGLTERQHAVLEAIRRYQRTHHRPPTLRELGEMLEIRSTKGVRDHLVALERKGFLRRGRQARDLELVEEMAPSGIPLLGRVAAGSPIFAEGNIEGYLSPETVFSGSFNELFALQVQGDSMIEAGILNGDLAILRRQTSAEDGEIICALIDEEATLKRFKRKGRKVHLVAENPAYNDIIPDDLQILGKFIGLIRDVRHLKRASQGRA